MIVYFNVNAHWKQVLRWCLCCCTFKFRMQMNALSLSLLAFFPLERFLCVVSGSAKGKQSSAAWKNRCRSLFRASPSLAFSCLTAALDFSVRFSCSRWQKKKAVGWLHLINCSADCKVPFQMLHAMYQFVSISPHHVLINASSSKCNCTRRKKNTMRRDLVREKGKRKS